MCTNSIQKRKLFHEECHKAKKKEGGVHHSVRSGSCTVGKIKRFIRTIHEFVRNRKNDWHGSLDSSKVR